MHLLRRCTTQNGWHCAHARCIFFFHESVRLSNKPDGIQCGQPESAGPGQDGAASDGMHIPLTTTTTAATATATQMRSMPCYEELIS
eukprot:scaffold244531_cov16-Tisochrysis_lutea.AAC.1